MSKMTNLKDGDDIEKSSLTTEDITLNPNHNFSNEQTTQKIPLHAENFEVTKKTEEIKLNLTKRWATTTKKIEIPIKYEELLVNDKELDTYTEHEITEILSKIKHKITDVFSLHDKDKENDNDLKKQQQQQQKMHEQAEPKQLQEQNKVIDESDDQLQYSQHSSKIDVKKYDKTDEAESDIDDQSYNRKLIPFSIHSKDDNNTLTEQEHEKEKEENIIPLWGEEISINKKMVKIGEIVIRKYQTTKKQKIDVDVKSEKIIVKYPDGRQEDIV